jgi:hypothetical protein
MLLTLLVVPSAVNGQSFALYGAAGPTITDPGNSVAVGVGFSPASRLTLVFNAERTHLSSRTTGHGALVSHFRGGTLLLGTAELRVAPFGRGRFGPFGVAGLAAGVSRPNVNNRFPNRITNRVRAMLLGGGVDLPVGERLSVFADVRMTVGADGNEGMVAVAPLRAGLSWRF